MQKPTRKLRRVEIRRRCYICAQCKRKIYLLVAYAEGDVTGERGRGKLFCPHCVAPEVSKLVPQYRRQGNRK